MMQEKEMKILIESATNTFNKYAKNTKKWVKAIYRMNEYLDYSLFYVYEDGENPSILLNEDGTGIYGIENANEIKSIINNHRIICYKDINTKWNKGNITVYPNGKYESSFIWDNEANLDILNDQVWAFLHYLGEYLENCFLDFPNIYPDWVSSDVKLISKSGKYFAEGIAINKTSQVPFNFALSDNFNADYFQMQVESLDKELDYLWKSTNTAELKERFKPWNALILHLEYLRYFDAEVYTEFIFEENT